MNSLKASLLILSLVLGCAAQNTKPVFKTTGGPVGLFSYRFEARPGLIYAMSVEAGTNYGATIISVSSTGSFKSIYVFPYANNTNVETLAQAPNGLL